MTPTPDMKEAREPTAGAGPHRFKLRTDPSADAVPPVGFRPLVRRFVAGTVPKGVGYGGRPLRVYVEAGITSSVPGGLPRLSVVATVGAGSRMAASGRLRSFIADIASAASGELPRPRLLGLADIEDRWHLNDLRAGCVHQEGPGWEAVAIPDGPMAGKCTAHVYDTDDSRGFLLKPCPTCGYKYGSQWLYEPLPPEVVAFIESLPDTVAGQAVA